MLYQLAGYIYGLLFLIVIVARAGRSQGSDSDVGDMPKIPRTNSTADIMSQAGSAPAALPAHPEGPNIGPGSANSWFQKERCVRQNLLEFRATELSTWRLLCIAGFYLRVRLLCFIDSRAPSFLFLFLPLSFLNPSTALFSLGCDKCLKQSGLLRHGARE